MSDPRLLLVPSLVKVELFQSFVDYGFLVLDVLLDQGVAGVLFRRMRLMAAFDPEMRSRYDTIRFQYLSSILPLVVASQKDVIVVGTHPADVDLMSYSSVSVLKLSESGLRDLSVTVYGEPVMLSTEYALVNSIVSDSVDAVHELSAWSALDVLLAREFGSSVVGYTRLSATLVSAKLRAALVVADMPLTLLEPELDFASPGASQRVALTFDYLSAIAVEWRDPVVGLLGVTPSIDMAFKLPWYVVDVPVFRAMCYRQNASGVPAISMRGESLVDLVTNRMAGLFTPGQLVGTWVGAILSERATAAQAAVVLRGRSMVTAMSGEEIVKYVGSSVSTSTASYMVPESLSWVYAACVGVLSVASESELSQLVEVGAAVMPPTLELARRLSTEEGEHRRVEVAAFMRRVHGLGDRAVDLIAEFCRVYDLALQRDYNALDGDASLLHLLPGMTYLGLFLDKTRLSALRTLGVYPQLGTCLSYVSAVDGFGVQLVKDELTHMATKLAVLSGGTVMASSLLDLPVGAVRGSYANGYCYLLLFDPAYHGALRALGPYPSLRCVLAVPVGMRSFGCRFRVRFSLQRVPGRAGYVFHFSRRYGYPFSVLQTIVNLLDSGYSPWKSLLRLPVGASSISDSSGPNWFVLAMVFLTTSVMLTLFIIGWAIYKCRGQSRGGGGGAYRR